MPKTQLTSECLSDDLLKRYLAGYLPEDSATQIEQHLSQCTECEELMREIDSDVRCDELLRPLQNKSTAQNPDSIQDSESSNLDSSQEAPPRPWLPWMVNREVGPYELIEPLGHGGMGLVYVARHRKLDRLVAIKLLPAHHQTAEARVRFEREILAAGRLQHPSIVSATDAGQFGDMDYLVMEYIRGIDLGRLSKCVSTYSYEEACEIGRQIAIGLSYAHAQGFVHRDIKPSNVILDDAGNVKLLDFGLVLFDRWDGVSNELTTVGQFLGTLDYMAPEQAERCGSVDFRADLYALGATLFKLLCGRAPLAAAPNQSPIDKLRLLATHRPPSLRTLKPGAPEALVQLVDCLLATDPQSRPASAAHVAEELQPLAKPGCLVDLIARARRTELAQQTSNVSVEMAKQEKAAFVLPISMSQTIGDKEKGNRWWPWIAVALVLLAFLAGYIIQLDTPDGQFIVESEVPGAQVKIVKAGAETKSFKIETGNSVTKLSAGKYEVTLDSPSDGVSIDRDTFVIERGAVVIARIRKAPAERVDPKVVPSPSTAATVAEREPIFDGKTLSEWLDVARREKDTKSWLVAMNALNALLDAEQKEKLFEEVFQLCLVHDDLSTANEWGLSGRFVDRLQKEIETAETKEQFELCTRVGQEFTADKLNPIWQWLENKSKNEAAQVESLVWTIMGKNVASLSDHKRVTTSSILYLAEHFPRLAVLLDNRFIELWPNIISLSRRAGVEIPLSFYFQRLALKQLNSTEVGFAHRVAAVDILLSRERAMPGNYFDLNPTQQEVVCSKTVELIETAWDNREVPFFDSWNLLLSVSGINFNSDMSMTAHKRLSAAKLLFLIQTFLERIRPDIKARDRILSALAILEENSRGEASTALVELPKDLSEAKLSECQFSHLDLRLAGKFKLRNPSNGEERVVYPLSQSISAERKAKIDEWCFAYNVHRLVTYMLWGSKPPLNLSPTEIGQRLAGFRSLDLDHDWLLSDQELPDGLRNFKPKNTNKVDIATFGEMVANENDRRKNANAIQFPKLDRDHDKLLNRDEASTIEDFDTLDSNSDGFLDANEFGLRPLPIKQPSVQSTQTLDSKTISDMRAWAEKKLKDSDKDGNGFLSPNEFPGDFAKVDLNGDGKIDIDEYIASRTR